MAKMKILLRYEPPPPSPPRRILNCMVSVTELLMFPSKLQALLKKHEALMSDLRAYGSSIQSLREQAQGCRVGTKELIRK